MTQKEVIMQLEGLCVEPEPNKEPRLDADELDAVLIAIEALKARPHGKTNAEIFKQTFGIYASELWTMSNADFMEWLNSDNREGGKA